MHRIILALAVLGVASPALADDEVKLKNGDRLTGKVAGLAKGKLAFESPHSGPLMIDWAQVTSITTEAKVKVRLVTGEMLEGKLSPGQDGRLKVATEGAAAPIEVEMSKVTHFNQPPVQWHGTLSGAARATDGNTHTTSGLVTGEAIRATESDLILVRTVFRYGERSGEIQERNGYGLGKYQLAITEGLYGYASVELLSDKFKDLRLGTVLSAGAGYDLLKESWIDFQAEAGLAFFDNDFRFAKDESHIGARLATRLRMTLPLGFELKDLFTYYPNFEETEDWQVRNEGTIGTSVGGGWSLLGGVISEVDHEPSPGKVEYDNTYFVGLGYAF